VNKVIGYVVIAIAVIYLLVSASDFLPKYNSVPYLVEHQEELGLVTTTTNLRFHMMWEMIVDVLITAVLGIAGWWITTTETQQYGYLIAVGLVLLAFAIIWNTPLIPFHVARVSPQGAFYNALVQVELNGDSTSYWVIVPQRKGQRVALTEKYQDRKLIGKKEVVLEFGNDSALLNAYLQATRPVLILGKMSGTRLLAVDRYIYTVPSMKVMEVKRPE